MDERAQKTIAKYVEDMHSLVTHRVPYVLAVLIVAHRDLELRHRVRRQVRA